MDKENREFGKKIGEHDIQYAPYYLEDEHEQKFVPEPGDDEAYYSRGWLKVVDIEPNVPGTQFASLTDWVEDHQAKTITAQYTIEDMPPEKVQIQVRRFSKLRLVEFCMERGVWQELKAFIEQLGYYDLFLMAQVFLENDKFFMGGLNAYKQMKIEGGADPEQIQATIDAGLDYAFDAYEMVDVEY